MIGIQGTGLYKDNISDKFKLREFKEKLLRLANDIINSTVIANEIVESIIKNTLEKDDIQNENILKVERDMISQVRNMSLKNIEKEQVNNIIDDSYDEDNSNFLIEYLICKKNIYIEEIGSEEAINQAFSSMKEIQKEIIIRKYYLCQKERNIASELGLSLEKTYKYINKSRNRFLKLFYRKKKKVNFITRYISFLNMKKNIFLDNKGIKKYFEISSYISVSSLKNYEMYRIFDAFTEVDMRYFEKKYFPCENEYENINKFCEYRDYMDSPSDEELVISETKKMSLTKKIITALFITGVALCGIFYIYKNFDKLFLSDVRGEHISSVECSDLSLKFDYYYNKENDQISIKTTNLNNSDNKLINKANEDLRRKTIMNNITEIGLYKLAKVYSVDPKIIKKFVYSIYYDKKYYWNEDSEDSEFENQMMEASGKSCTRKVGKIIKEKFDEEFYDTTILYEDGTTVSYDSNGFGNIDIPDDNYTYYIDKKPEYKDGVLKYIISSVEDSTYNDIGFSIIDFNNIATEYKDNDFNYEEKINNYASENEKLIRNIDSSKECDINEGDFYIICSMNVECLFIIRYEDGKWVTKEVIRPDSDHKIPSNIEIDWDDTFTNIDFRCEDGNFEKLFDKHENKNIYFKVYNGSTDVTTKINGCREKVIDDNSYTMIDIVDIYYDDNDSKQEKTFYSTFDDNIQIERSWNNEINNYSYNCTFMSDELKKIDELLVSVYNKNNSYEDDYFTNYNQDYCYNNSSADILYISNDGSNIDITYIATIDISFFNVIEDSFKCSEKAKDILYKNIEDYGVWVDALGDYAFVKYNVQNLSTQSDSNMNGEIYNYETIGQKMHEYYAGIYGYDSDINAYDVEDSGAEYSAELIADEEEEDYTDTDEEELMKYYYLDDSKSNGMCYGKYTMDRMEVLEYIYPSEEIGANTMYSSFSNNIKYLFDSQYGKDYYMLMDENYNKITNIIPILSKTKDYSYASLQKPSNMWQTKFYMDFKNYVDNADITDTDIFTKRGKAYMNFESDYIYVVYGNSAEIIAYIGDEKDVVIPEKLSGATVEYISESAFKYCDIESVVFPKGMLEVGYEAFFSCDKLKKVVLNDKLISIGSSAFGECVCLSDINEPKSVVMIDGDTFSNTPWYSNKELNCSDGYIYFANVLISIKEDRLKDKDTIKLKDNTISIAGRAIMACSAKNIEFNKGLEYICPNAITNSDIEEITIPDTVKYISYCAISECMKLKKVTIPGSVKYVDNIFQHCTSLEYLVVDEGVEIINTLLDDDSTIKAVYLPDSLLAINNNEWIIRDLGEIDSSQNFKDIVIVAGKDTIGEKYAYAIGAKYMKSNN